MSNAPQSVVDAVLIALRCRMVPVSPPTWKCIEHDCPNVPHRGCSLAVDVADAAWVASLEAAADRLSGHLPVTNWAADALRRWAGEQERGYQ